MNFSKISRADPKGSSSEVFNITLHPKGEHISDYIRNFNCWESYQSELILELKRKLSDFIFIDIGANIGYYSLLCASLNIKSIAFEPIEENYQLFERSINENNFNSLITLHKLALGDKCENKTFYISKINMGLCSVQELNKEINPYQESNVCIKLFDDVIPDISIFNKKVILKLDAEEYELEVLKGMTNALSSGKISHIFMEISKYQSDMFDILRKYNFYLGVNIGHDPQTGKTIDWNSTHLDNPLYYSNIDIIQKGIENVFNSPIENNKSKQQMYLFFNLFV